MTHLDLGLPEGIPTFEFRAPDRAVKVFADKPAKMKPLLQSLGEAVARSNEAGLPVRFQVEVRPSGRIMVGHLEAGAVETATTVEAVQNPATDADLQAALDEARQLAAIQTGRILSDDAMLSADQFASLLGTSRMTVNTRRQNHQILGLDGAKRGYRFPRWQVGENGKPFAALPALFERLGGGPWAVYRFLVQPHPELEGLTGREALHRGMAEEVLGVADGIAQGTFS